MSTQIVILAAGLGKRMHSNLPKVLHLLAGKPLLAHVISKAKLLTPKLAPVVVFGHQGEQLKTAFAHEKMIWAEQKQQLGTGHALQCALPFIQAEQVLILYGDVPLISVETLQRLLLETPKNAIGIITAELGNPSGYGRIVRNERHEIIKVVEDKDATPREKQIIEVNSGIYLIPTAYLQRWLPNIKSNNNQTEYYLTDIVPFAVAEKVLIHTVQPKADFEIFGINDRMQLSALERIYQLTRAYALMRQGVSIVDPARFDVRGEGEINIGKDVSIDINVILEGNVTIGDGCSVGANVVISNSALAAGTIIKPYSIIEGATIGTDCKIGPFARIRPQTRLQADVHIGNFVEIKHTQVKMGSKINHLSYIGDCCIGQKVNIGAGTITCNYDGAKKHQTVIGDHVFIGSDTQLVAPVSVGEGATIGAGSTITKDVPAHGLTLSHRLQQRVISDWQRPEGEL